MKELIITICASSDSFGAFAEEYAGIYGAGDSIDAAKQNVMESIDLIRQTMPESEWPDILKEDFAIVWKYDTATLLRHYQGIFTNSALERLTGINQKQLWSYAHGHSIPREKNRTKIVSALHRLGRELMALSL